MKYFFISLLIFCNIVFADSKEKRTNDITKNLKCLVCQGQSVYESNSDFAIDIKNFVKQEIVKNKTIEKRVLFVFIICEVSVFNFVNFFLILL